MPLFAFACRQCEKTTEILVRNGEAPVCPGCGGHDLEKQMSRFAPLSGSAPEPAGCGAPSCCRMQGGGCMN